jgi:hypothetical protein
MSKCIKAIAIGALTAAAIWMTLGAEAMAADGCGLSWYRGPNGACHRVGFGPRYGNYYGPGPSPYLPGPNRRCWQGPYGAWHCA